MDFLTMPAAAVKLGRPYAKDDKTHRYDTVTFIMADGDSFKLQIDGLQYPVKQNDVCVFGVRGVMTSENRPAVSLYISTVRPANFPSK